MNKNTLHHIATAIGFLFLIGWYLLFRKLGFLDWSTTQMPSGYEGSGLMIAIVVMMTPAFFIWSRFNRYVEKKLNIKGVYYEDSYYKENTKPNVKDRE